MYAKREIDARSFTTGLTRDPLSANGIYTFRPEGEIKLSK